MTALCKHKSPPRESFSAGSVKGKGADKPRSVGLAAASTVRCNFSIDVNPSPTDDIYVDEPWLLLRWDREHGCVFAEWKAFATSMEFQGALTKALEVGR